MVKQGSAYLALRARGELVLRGKSYEVDSYALRDRSWGQLRTEDQKAAPPMDWMNGVFDDDFCFGCTAFDDEGSDPDWKGILKIPGSGDPVTGGLGVPQRSGQADRHGDQSHRA